MKKLENIPKSNIFEVPNGYFDNLPLEIQARIEKNNPAKAQSPIFRYALQYSLPVVLVVIAILIFRPKSTPTVESILASVSTEQLVVYLEDSNLTTDELLNSYEFDNFSIEAIELEVYDPFDIDSTDLDLLENEISNIISDESIN